MCEQIKRKIHAVLLSSEQKIKKKEKKTNHLYSIELQPLS